MIQFNIAIELTASLSFNFLNYNIAACPDTCRNAYDNNHNDHNGHNRSNYNQSNKPDNTDGLG